MTRVLIYARVSTEDQVEKYGLPVQLRACREYAARRDMVVLEEITDEGVSGATLKRPGLSRVRSLVEAGSVDVVLMLDVDRLSRELAHLLILKPEIEKRARLEFVTAKFEDCPSGRMFFGISGVIAQYEREQTRERTMRGKRERLKSGKLIGGRVPFGYSYSDGTLTPDEASTARFVREMFSWYDAGASIRQVASRLRASGVRTWAGGKWGHSSVRCMLANETYAGLAHWGGESIGVPAIIDRAQFQRVQERLKANLHVGRPSARYLLRGLLRCAVCHSKMYGERCRYQVLGGVERVSYLYRCQLRDKVDYHGSCRTAAVKVEQLDAAVWKRLTAALTDRALLWGLFERRQAELAATASPEKLEELRGRVRKLKAREGQALSLLLDPDFAANRAEIKQRHQEAQRERVAVEREIGELERAGAKASAGWIDEMVELFRRNIPAITEEAERQEFVRDLVTGAEWSEAEGLNMRVFLRQKSTSLSRHSAQFPEGLELVLNVRLAA